MIMDKTAVLNKATSRNAQLCPSCGQPVSPSRCREVSGKGWFCWQNGLLDGSTNVLQIQARFRLAVSEDPSVIAAQSLVDRLNTEAERATAEWRRAWFAADRARTLRLTSKRDVVTNGGAQLAEWTPRGVPSEAEIRQLDELTAQAETMRQEAELQLTRARRTLGDATTRARQRVAQDL
jgi:hypothetical protein